MLEAEADATVGVAGRSKLFLAIAAGLLLAVAVGFLFFDRYATESDRSVAVLPFENLSAVPDDAYFVAGIHNDLLTRLANLSALNKVISRTSVMAYEKSPKNLRQIGVELGVGAILEGSVQRVGDMVRINVQLIDAETDQHLWAEVYDREVTAENLFAIQKEMATSIAEALQATLSPQDVMRLKEVPTRNTRAYEFYLSGNEYRVRADYSLDDYSLAVHQYQRALDEDPEFALAWTGLARTHAIMYFWGLDKTESRRELAREAVERALQLAPQLPEAHLAMGYYHYHGFNDYRNALEEWDIAAQGLAGDSDLYKARGYVYRRMGDLKLAAANMDRAVEIDPRNVDPLITQEVIYEELRDYTRAEQILDRIIEIAPDNHFASFRRPRVRIHRGDIISLEAAREMAATGMVVQPRYMWLVALNARDYDAALQILGDWDKDGYDSFWAFRPKATYYAMTYHLAGMPDLAEPQLHAARARIEQEMEVSGEDPRLLIALGEVLALLGEAESATDLAGQALLPVSTDATHQSTFRLGAIMIFVTAGDNDSAMVELDAYLSAPGEWSIEGLLPDPRLDTIRDDPRFQRLVNKYSR
jgi:serine/threonine-protein kinase